MKQPKISYLVSTYKSEAFMARHLDDLLNGQTDPDFEIIVIDSDSPERDGEIAQEYAARDDRVKYIKQPKRTNYGVSWLKGWEQAKGEYVSNSNTDDLHHPTFNAVIYNAMLRPGLRSTSRVGFCYAGLDVIGVDGVIKASNTKPAFNFEQYSYACHGGPQLTWLNDSSFKDMLDWPLMYERAAQHHSAFDYWLMLFFMSLGFGGLSIQQVLTIYTQRPDSIENKCYGGASTYESLASISEFFPHHFQGRLKKDKAFADFKNLPPKDEWVACRKAGKRWK